MIATIRIRDVIKYLVILTSVIVLLVAGARYFFRIKSNVGAGEESTVGADDSARPEVNVGAGLVSARERTEL